MLLYQKNKIWRRKKKVWKSDIAIRLYRISEGQDSRIYYVQAREYLAEHGRFAREGI